MSSSSSSVSCNWRYDVFPSFRGEDIRKTFVSHFLTELDRKFISAFKDNKIKKGQTLDPVLKEAIKDSRIAIVIFTENYASSAWCLNEMLKIVKCKKKLGQLVIPVFYRLDPSHVRKQSGDFGKIFEETCRCNDKTEDEIKLWRTALTDVANQVGFDSRNWENDAKLVEDMVSNILEKLTTPSKDFENIVGIEDHFVKMSALLDLKSEGVKTVGIWGPSGIGKTTIARALYNRLSHQFQGRIFIDMRFISESIKDYSKGNPRDYNMKLHLQENFLSKILDKEGMTAQHLGTVGDKLKHQRVLIFIDDLDDQVVLDALAGADEWFGPGSRIIAISKDKHILRAHGITCIYEVGLPSEKVALQMFCQSAFKQNSPPDRFLELASKVAVKAGRLPLGLHVLGASLRGRDDKSMVDIMSSSLKGLDTSIKKTLSISYEGLERKEYKAMFRHIACFFNGYEINSIKLMLSDSELNVDACLEILVDKSLIRVLSSAGNNTNIVEMHCLVQEMGKEIVRAQSDNPGNREYLMDSKDICDVLRGCTGTEKVIGISLDLCEVDKVRIDDKAFKRMFNLRFLNFYKKTLEWTKEVKWQLPKRFKYFPDELKLLSWPGFPMESMPSDFCPEYLVELRLPNSKLKKLWKGVKTLTCLKDMDLSESKHLEKIPDLSTATNLETLNLHGCSSLVELPSSIQNLNKLTDLNMAGCTKLESFPNANLESLIHLVLTGCSQLKVFPDISSKVESIIANKTSFEIFPSPLRLENLIELRMEQILSERLWDGVQPLTSLRKILLSGSENLKEIPDLSMAKSLKTLNLNGCSSLVEITLSSFQNLNKLTDLNMAGCTKLESLPSGINLESLYRLNLNGCSKLKSFPDISSNISTLYLNQTAIEEVPQRIENYLSLESLEMWECKELKCISSRIFELENLVEVFFSDCEQLDEVTWPQKAQDTNNTTGSNLSLISFTNCFNSNQEAFIQNSASNYLILPGEVPPYFTHRSSSSSITFPLHPSYLSQQSFLEFKACVVFSDLVISDGSETLGFIDIEVQCRFRDKNGNYFELAKPRELSLHLKYNHQLIFDCHFPLSQECDQVEINFNLPSNRVKLKECGLRLSDDYTQIEVDG
ncbi:hypothetical protein EUTSA_v10000753mg [Eutrema salsugineum]|uniref:ADP-ribosyl cyclase/cyclic ADP-ribose hydrolase n=1 Tax=Eutrema salsugineum TaxID=72664 RepID=V4LJ22_EUTSA|nr:disease resistance protein RPS6 [Eutrema salsugineum]ESQ39798.1 hypothetical protein EUTSA_v10000753mg [Eutrema salsugineum]